jgi:WD40 repeat protein
VGQPNTFLAGGLLASSSWDGTVKLWDLADARLVRTLRGHGDAVRGVAAHGCRGAILRSGLI